MSFRKGINASGIANEILFLKEKIGVESPADALEIDKNVVVTQEELYLPVKWFVIKKEQTIL